MLNLIAKYNYSQFPVFENDQLVGMLTDNGITNYIAELNEVGGIFFDEKNVSDIIADTRRYEENKESYLILYQEDELYRVLNAFSDVEDVIKYILISKSGNRVLRSEDDLISIFTTADIPNIVHYLNNF